MRSQKKRKLGKVFSPLLKSRKVLSAINAALLLGLANGSAAFAAQAPQYGFAHRVNDSDYIDDALASDINGIEFDLCYTTRLGGTWLVSHADVYCYNETAETLEEWMIKLKSLLDANPSYASKFSMLWVDTKTPDPDGANLWDAVEIIRRYTPSNLWVNYGFYWSDANKRGFQKISQYMTKILLKN